MTTALEVRGLVVRYGGVLAVDDVSFGVGAGTVTGLIGPNGAGKTSVIDIVSGFGRPAGGTVRLAGTDITGSAAHRVARLGLARTFQTLELFDDLTVEENLLVAAVRPSWWSPLVDLVAPQRATRGTVTRVAAVLEQLDLADAAALRPDELSNGRRHLVAIARALVADPAVLLLDEPVAGLDTAETERLAGTIAALPGRGVSVLLVDHDMSLVLGVCDRVHVLDQGRLLASGTPADVRADPAVVAAYLGTELAP